MSENQIGISCIICGMFFFSIQDLLIKTVGLDVSLIQIVVSRAAIGIIFLSVFLYFSGRKIYFGSSYPFIATLRGILFFAGFLLFYIALSEISLAQATSLFFVSPLFMTRFDVEMANGMSHHVQNDEYQSELNFTLLKSDRNFSQVLSK